MSELPVVLPVFAVWIDNKNGAARGRHVLHTGGYGRSDGDALRHGHSKDLYCIEANEARQHSHIDGVLKEGISIDTHRHTVGRSQLTEYARCQNSSMKRAMRQIQSRQQKPSSRKHHNKSSIGNPSIEKILSVPA